MKKGKTAASRSKNTQRIVDAACELFGEKEYQEITVRDICERAGVSGSSFYSVFAGKDEIVTYVIQGMRDDSKSVIDLLITSSSDLEKIWKLFDRILGFALRYGPDFLKTLLFISSARDDVTRQFYQYSDWFESLVRNCQKSGIIRNLEDPKALVQAASHAAFGVGYEWSKSHGEFDLREACFRCHESIYNVAPEYRGVWKTIQ